MVADVIRTMMPDGLALAVTAGASGHLPAPAGQQPGSSEGVTVDRQQYGPMGPAGFERRPWGGFEVLDDADDHKVKRMVVHPGGRLSYQRHHRRAEHWFVVAGRGVVTLDGTTIEVHPGQAVDVPRGSAHRIANPGDGDLVFIEVQHGDSFGEDDIVRLEDDYGRRES
jgi:mannose-6-phosphate isomerase